ncbi:uncharacterized protein LOC112052248 [Bicyclus anynana]|uniref:Uncharacterized protein LOC112052248 n=1 Tax=Bicyclus anynana TaxID=110368 RepID=A0ABM3LWR3_BICAN|nr:uncharacterized protein LOC112052248 [Bicyclus anynana]
MLARAKSDVGRMVDHSQADDRRLIRLVRERRVLYARCTMPVASYYSQVKQLWSDVAAAMGWTVADVRRKWSHIRNSYSRHLRNEMHGACTSRGRMVSRWYLADELEFLREHMATDIRKPTPYSSFSPTMVDMDVPEPPVEAVDVKPFPWFLGATPPSPKPAEEAHFKPPSLVNEDSSNSTNFAPEENSSFFQFFRGIHNDYQELPVRKRRLFKRKCLDLLHALLDEEEGQDDDQRFGFVGAASSPQPDDSVLNLSNSGHVSEEDRKPAVDDCLILPHSAPAQS